MICATAFATATIAGLGNDIVGVGLGAWALGLLLFIVEAARAQTSKGHDLGAAEVASLVFIAATFAPDDWLDTVVRVAAVGSVALCEL
jgi:hypothetical protein